MISFRLLSSLSQVYFILFASFALAIINVTVDDSVSTGPVVPNYLPNNSIWRLGNSCTTCSAHPDRVVAFHGTWHDIIYYPSGGFVPSIEVSFTGNALYIFFIIANNLPGLVKLTDIYFELDNVNVSSYIQIPDNNGNTTSYQYNVPVYHNDTLDFGPHTMTVSPVLAGNNVQMLFDYLIYSTTDASTENSSSTTSPSATSTASPSESSPSSLRTSSGRGISAIIGGTVGGGAFLLLAASLSCYWIYKRRHGDGRPSTEEWIHLREPTSTTCTSRGNTSIDSSDPARSPSPDLAIVMRQIHEQRKQGTLSRKSQEVVS